MTCWATPPKPTPNAQLARDTVKLAAEPVADSLAADLDTTENVSVVK